jgi:AcrR family transcriptional regulator
MSSEKAVTTATPRRPLQDRVTDAISTAFFEELAEVGYGQLSVDAVVRRAGVGKAAVYRRWPNKSAMAVALIAKAAVSEELVPDTGTLHGDLVVLMSQMSTALRHPLASRVIPAVAAEAGRDRELELVLRETVEAPRRASIARILHRAIARGELPSDCDLELALDLVAGPLYWRLLVRRRDLDAASRARLADGVLAAIAAVRQESPSGAG